MVNFSVVLCQLRLHCCVLYTFVVFLVVARLFFVVLVALLPVLLSLFFFLVRCWAAGIRRCLVIALLVYMVASIGRSCFLVEPAPGSRVAVVVAISSSVASLRCNSCWLLCFGAVL